MGLMRKSDGEIIWPFVRQKVRLNDYSGPLGLKVYDLVTSNIVI